MKKIVLFFLLTTWIHQVSIGQDNRLNGKVYGVVSTAENKPAEFATVRLLRSPDSTFVKGITTDQSGSYELTNIPAGSYLLSVASVGYKKSFSTLSVSPMQWSVKKDVVLTEDAKMLAEVKVVSSKPFIESHPDKTVLNVESSIVSAGSTALEVLQKAPGVSLDKDDNISLKGKQGVTVLIDGKPTHLSPSDLSAMLRSMPANSIAQMEVISNPSAKYDAAGNSGIINIKTKKNKQEGFNGSISAGTGYARDPLYNGGLNLNYKKGKFNWYGNYNYAHTSRYLGINVDRAIAGAQAKTFFNQYSDGDSRYDNNSIKAGVDYELSSRSTIGFLINGFINKGDGSGINNTHMLNSSRQLDSMLTVSNNENKRFQSQSYNLNYRTKLDTAGQELSFDLDYSKFDGRNEEFLDNYYFTRQGESSRPARFNRSYAPTNIDIRSAKLDYAFPLSKSVRLEAGLKTSFVKTDNDYQYQYLASSIWNPDLEKTNHFKYDENINAAYVNFSKEFGKTSVQLGLRAEQTRSKGNSVTKNIVVDSSYLRVFPTVFLSRKINDKQTIGLSLSQRVDRPGYQDLNPFLFLLDEYTYRQGNPYLRPQYTNSIEMNYSYAGALNVSAGYSDTRDVMITLTEQNDQTKTTIATTRNMEWERSYYLGFNGTIPVFKWWSSTNNLQGFYLGFKDADLNAGRYAVQFNSNNNFTLPGGLRAELNGFYQSPLNYSIFRVKEQYRLDAGVQKSLMNKQVSLKLSISDIFNSQKTQLYTSYRNMDMHLNERYNTRQTKLTLTYRFGNSNLKASSHKSGVEDEQKRIRQGQ